MQIKQVVEHYDRQEIHETSDFAFCPHCQTPLIMAESGNRNRPTCQSCGFIHYKNPSPAVSVLIVDSEQVLLGKRAGHPGKGKWAIPSGYIEYGCDFITTAILEAKEETGLDIEVEGIINVTSSFYSPHFEFLAIYLKAHVVRGKLEAADDLDEVRWFYITKELPEMAFAEDVEILSLYSSGNYKELPVDIAFSCRVDKG